MDFDLNDEDEYAVRYGVPRGHIPELVGEDRDIASVQRIMKEQTRVDCNGAWRTHRFVTGDAGIYHPNGAVKIVLDSKHLHEVTAWTILDSGGIMLREQDYHDVEGREFSAEALKTIRTNNMDYEDVKQNPILQTLAQDQGVLDRWADRFFLNQRSRMDIVFPEGVADLPILLRPFEMQQLPGTDSLGRDRKGILNGNVDFDCENAYVIGVHRKAIDRDIREAIHNGKGFVHNGTAYTPYNVRRSTVSE